MSTDWRESLRRILGEVMASERAGGALNDSSFLALALEIFRYQADAIPAYGAWIRRRGIDPRSAVALSDILPVPTRAFRDLRLLAEGSPVQATFRTSGTASGPEKRGTHFVRDLDLYRTSIVVSSEGALFSNVSGEINRTRIRILSLTPSPEQAPNSSLAYMIGVWMGNWDDGGGGFFGDALWVPRLADLSRALSEASEEGVPVLLVGTAFSFVQWLDELPPGHPHLANESLILETGGFKGRSRAVPRAELYGALSNALGISVSRIVNEYGMTELLSQFYEPVLSKEAPEDPESRWHVGPSWVRTRILDPETLEPVVPGQPGLLCHVDLANLDSAVAVLTEDVGVEIPVEIRSAPGAHPDARTEAGRAFRLLGRAQGAEPRGCSLVMEELLGEAGLARNR